MNVAAWHLGGPDRILANGLTSMTEVSWLCSLQANAGTVH